MSMALNISDIQLFNSIKKKLGEKEAEELIAFVKTEIEAEINAKVPNIATKDFVDAKVSESKSDIIKWVFVFVFTSTLTIIGSVIAIFKFFLK
jgi:hypothetical protein